jgi:plastocyanin
MRRLGLILLVLLTTAPLIGTSAVAEDAPRHAVTVSILGRQTVTANGRYLATYHFPDEPIRVAQGGTITFMNKTDDAHNITLVKKSDLPVPLNGKPVDAGAIFNNCAICNAVDQTYGGSQNGPPSGLQIDNGVLSDDDAEADADVTDTGAIASATNPLPPGLPVLVADFDTPSTGGVTPTVGDSTLVGPQGSGFPTQRTVQMTGKPGTYWYMCTFHPWMEGSIVVESDGSD